jgi:hypothetical protein
MKENCQCKNVTSATGEWSLDCTCLREDTGLKGIFGFAKNQCLTNGTNLTSTAQCCVSKEQAQTQVPTIVCAADSQ